MVPARALSVALGPLEAWSSRPVSSGRVVEGGFTDKGAPGQKLLMNLDKKPPRRCWGQGHSIPLCNQVIAKNLLGHTCPQACSLTGCGAGWLPCVLVLCHQKRHSAGAEGAQRTGAIRMINGHEQVDEKNMGPICSPGSGG